MARLPQIRRLMSEDYPQQKSWITKLFVPLNTFMESVVGALDRSLTVKENLAGDFVTVTLSTPPTATAPAAAAWTLKRAPLVLLVAGVARQDGAAVGLSAAVAVEWSYGTKGLQLTNVVGITPSSANVYVLTLLALTG